MNTENLESAIAARTNNDDFKLNHNRDSLQFELALYLQDLMSLKLNDKSRWLRVDIIEKTFA